ncbi:6-phosphogluconolactonase like protein [Verticillium longisporum]|nr:6-phosphogluconolactonase like protein [Verticillium longisporum]
MRLSVGLALLAAAAASAATIRIPAKKQETAPASKVLIGGPGQIIVADFDGTSFDLKAKNSLPGTSPSWMAFKEPNTIYAVDENGKDLRIFKYNAARNEIKLDKSAVGSAGVVHLEFSTDQTRLVAGSYVDGKIDIWDIANSTLRLIKSVTSDGGLGPNKARQDQPRVHQVVRDPSGRYFAANDLGTDTVLLLDSAADSYAITTRVRVKNAGCGPRHGVFVPSADGTKATHYVLVCELLNRLEVFEVTYADDGIQFAEVQSLSTFGNTPHNATSALAGAIAISDNGKDIYVSNRLTGTAPAPDSIAHFRVAAPEGSACGSDSKDGSGSSAVLEFAGLVSSAGGVPRMFSLSTDGGLLFSTNQNSGLGLLALERNKATGELTEKPVASVGVADFGEAGFGPQFVQQIA